MASSSSSLATKMLLKLVVFKFQNVPAKSRFQDDYSEIQDTKIGHTDWNMFLVLCNKPIERSPMISSLLRLGLVYETSHPILVQSSELIMALAENYVSEERVT
jgi:hypothetical protein